ncbi:MAG: DUF4886 domain-containing protein [Oscillospiraceae bacterium]|nr:DUF4886 domain-containing protein [Oscillospiraceae bacterium]
MKKFLKKLVCFALAFVFTFGTMPAEASALEENEEIKEDTLQQALFLIPEEYPDIDFLGEHTVPEAVTVEEVSARLEKFIEMFEGKFFTVDGNYCKASGVHASSCDNCLMSNVIAEKWVQELVGMGTLDASLCPTQYSYKGTQGSADGWQCFGFANFAHWYIFAGKNTDKVTSTLEKTGPLTYETIKEALPGDVLRSNYYGGHSMIFISCDETGFNVIDSNHTGNADGKSACIVKVHKVKYNASYTVAITGTTNYDRTVECEHSYSEEITPPTCTEQGYTTYTCKFCGESYTDMYIPATGHTEVIGRKILPTSSRTGLTEGKHCSVCGETLVAQEVIPAKGYDWMFEDGEFKILLIGNSYSQDAANLGQGMNDSQLFNILRDMLGEDVKVTLGILSSGGKSISWFATQAERGKDNIGFYVITPESGTWTNAGGKSVEGALKYTDWDVVTLQPYSVDFTTGEELVRYPEETEEKFYPLESATEFMLDYIAEKAPRAETYCYMHWAYVTNIELNAGLSKYNKMADFYPINMEYFGAESGKQYDAIIPVGLSIQNARTTYLALLNYNKGEDITLESDPQVGLLRDSHLSLNVGRYIASLTFAETIIPEEMRAEEYVLPDIRTTESVGKLPKEYTEIAQKSVFAAVESWKNGSLAVTEIEGYEVDPVDTESTKLAETKITVSYAADEESLKARISEAVFAALPEDFDVESVEFTEGFKIEGEGQELEAEIKIRFGYMYKTVSVFIQIEDSLMGDLNLDGVVDVMDAYTARLIAAKLIKPTEQQILVGDVDGDGKITAVDANYIRKFVAYIIDKFPVEK